MIIDDLYLVQINENLPTAFTYISSDFIEYEMSSELPFYNGNFVFIDEHAFNVKRNP